VIAQATVTQADLALWWKLTATAAASYGARRWRWREGAHAVRPRYWRREDNGWLRRDFDRCREKHHLSKRGPFCLCHIKELLLAAPCFPLLVLGSIAQERRADDGAKYTYEVRGRSNLSSEDRPWSRPYDDEANAKAELESIRRADAKGGLREYDPEKPVGLYIQKYRNRVRVTGNTDGKEQDRKGPSLPTADQLHKDAVAKLSDDARKGRSGPYQASS
jgi:hypothetical protein